MQLLVRKEAVLVKLPVERNHLLQRLLVKNGNDSFYNCQWEEDLSFKKFHWKEL
jgi:hypothetical protein